jgi:hypothetical protein
MYGIPHLLLAAAAVLRGPPAALTCRLFPLSYLPLLAGRPPAGCGCVAALWCALSQL